MRKKKKAKESRLQKLLEIELMKQYIKAFLG